MQELTDSEYEEYIPSDKSQDLSQNSDQFEQTLEKIRQKDMDYLLKNAKPVTIKQDKYQEHKLQQVDDRFDQVPPDPIVQMNQNVDQQLQLLVKQKIHKNTTHINSNIKSAQINELQTESKYENEMNKFDMKQRGQWQVNKQEANKEDRRKNQDNNTHTQRRNKLVDH